MPFVNRYAERAQVEALARDVQRGASERHLALVGPRRIGKTRIIEVFRDTAGGPGADIAIAYLKVDRATATIQTYLVEMARAIVAAYARRAGEPEPNAALTVHDLVVEATKLQGALGEAIAPAARLASSKRPDGHQLFMSATTLPQSAAKATSVPMLVLADEFQHILDLAAYAPFRVSAAGGRGGNPGPLNILKAFRAGIDHAPSVGWIVTGSSVRLMSEILDGGPLMGRFDILRVGAFGPRETRRLAVAIWDEQGVTPDEAAADRVDALTVGHPFYADLVARRVSLEAYKLGTRRAAADLVDLAFLQAIHEPSGGIWIACQEMWDSIVMRRPGLRGMVLALATSGQAKAIDLAAAIGLPSESAAWPQVRELEKLGLVEDVDGEVRLVDPVFRYWLVTAFDPAARAEMMLADADAAARAIKRYQEAYLAERAERGHLVEAYLRDVCRNFAGQTVEGKRFGMAGTHVRLPEATSVRRAAAFDADGEVFGYPSEIELDLCVGEDPVWLGEVRDRSSRPSPTEVEVVARKSAFLRRALGLPDGPTWFVSFSGFGQAASSKAKELGVYLSNDRDIEAIAAAVGVLRPSA